MSNQMKPVSDYELHAYVDGELDGARRVEVEAWLAAHPADKAKVGEYRKIQERLHARFDAVLAEPLDSQLPPVGENRFGGFARAAAVALLMLGSGLTGWSLNRSGETLPLAMSELVQPAAFAHVVYSNDTRYPVEIAGVEQASLNSWVSRRMHTDLRAPELDALGLSLVGGRLLPSTNRMAAQYMYEDAQGRRLTVYVRRISGQGEDIPDFRFREEDGLGVFYWIDQAMGYAVIGEYPAARLIAVANAVQSAFRVQSGQAASNAAR